MVSCGTFQKLSPLSLLAHLSSCYDSAHLQVTSGPASWSIYLEEGKITYAAHSIAPFDRLDCHLHRLSHKIPKITSEIRAQLSLIFEADTENNSISNPEYQAIGWLVNHQYLNLSEAAELVAGLVAEVIESFLQVNSGTYELGENLNEGQAFCQLDFQPIVDRARKRLKGWKSLAPQVWSPYQRLYFSNRHKVEQPISPEVQQKLSAILKGFSFRHLAVLLNQDELQLAQNLHQYIGLGIILLQDPYPPFDQLPKTFEYSTDNDTPTIKTEAKPLAFNNNDNKQVTIPPRSFTQNQSIQFPPRVERVNSHPAPESVRENPSYHPVTVNPPTVSKPVAPTANPPVNLPDTPVTKHTYKIVCVDDSPAILQELNRCLEDDIFSVSTINNPVKALMQIIKIKPDLVLLDVNMAGIDGYELCRLLRNHSLFKSTPIIMVTANTGIINRVKARLVGASGYLTKPFSQSDILKIVFRHLT